MSWENPEWPRLNQRDYAWAKSMAYEFECDAGRPRSGERLARRRVAETAQLWLAGRDTAQALANTSMAVTRVDCTFAEAVAALTQLYLKGQQND